MGGERLKEVRGKLQLTQTEIGKKIGIPWTRIRDIESGKQKINTEIAEKIEEIFFINGWWLLTGKGEMLKLEIIESAKEGNNKEIKIKKKRDNNFEEIEEALEKLPRERQKYYYFKIIAESLEEASKKNAENINVSQY